MSNQWDIPLPPVVAVVLGVLVATFVDVVVPKVEVALNGKTRMRVILGRLGFFVSGAIVTQLKALFSAL